LLTREDNADEESIRPYLPPIVEAKANAATQTISPASTARKEVSLTIENTLEGDLPETIDEIEEDIPVTETSKDEASDELVKRFGLYDPTLDLPNYQFPSVSLLKDYDMGKAQVSQEELKANSNKIVDTLGHYGIGIADIKATIGPTVTLYEIIPDAGVRISKIKNLEDDISLALAALGIRIIAPIPGKGTIGIEVPNKTVKWCLLRW
jgi:S-DNA-T family DNA segregation ATPase FtsK/SpoIIIE